MNSNLNKPLTNDEVSKSAYMMQESPYGIYSYGKIIVLYDETGTYNLTNGGQAPSSKTLLEDGDKVEYKDLDEKIKEKIVEIKETRLGKIYTKDQITLMLYPDLLEGKFISLLSESQFSEFEKENIKKAITIMKASHKNQFRNEGLPYYVHPLKVSFDILKNGGSYEAIIGGLLHDVIEDDKNIEINKLINLFGEDIINNVLILSKTIGNGSKINQDDYMKKIQESKIAIEIKGYDRLNNIASTYFINNEKREKYINETENIYVPFFEQHSPEIAKRIKEILKYLKTNEQPTEKELQQIKQVHDSYILINKITE